MTSTMPPELNGLRMLFAFGMPGGKTKIQKMIGRYLDGGDHALDKAPAIRRHIDKALKILEGDAA